MSPERTWRRLAAFADQASQDPDSRARDQDLLALVKSLRNQPAVIETPAGLEAAAMLQGFIPRYVALRAEDRAKLAPLVRILAGLVEGELPAIRAHYLDQVDDD